MTTKLQENSSLIYIKYPTNKVIRINKKRSSSKYNLRQRKEKMAAYFLDFFLIKNEFLFMIIAY